MSLTVAIQMDPIETIDIEADSTFALALEAQARGHRLYHYLPRQLSLTAAGPVAAVRPLRVRDRAGDHATLGAPETVALATMDVVLMRQDPPFDMAYITATHILEQIHPETLVVNDPVHVRNAPEKLFVTRFRELDAADPDHGRARHDRRVPRDARRHHPQAAVRQWRRRRVPRGPGGREPQRADRDVRHLLPRADHRPGLSAGGSRRRQAHHPGRRRAGRCGEPRAPRRRGARQHACRRPPEKAGLSDRDREICAAIGPALRERGLIFTGIDVIGGYLTEINVTSPTGIREIGRLDGTRLEALVWDAIEARLKRA